MLRETGLTDLAIEKLKQVVEMDPNFVFAYSELGAAYRITGDLDGAGRAYSRAVTLDSWSVADQRALAEVREEEGRFAEAGAAYARLAELEPEDVGAEFDAARCYLAAGQTVPAMVHGERARQMDEGSRDVALLLARIYEAQNDHDEAVAVYRRLLQQDDGDVEVMLAMGVAQIMNEQCGLARDILTQVLRLKPELGVAARHLAYCHLKLGDADEAVLRYEQALAADANDWEAHRGLGVALMIKARQTDDERWERAALQHWRDALALNPDQPGRDKLRRLIKQHATTMDLLEGLDN